MKKRFFALVIATVMLMSAFAPKSEPTVYDALEILKSLAGLPSTASGDVTIYDALEVLKHLAGLESVYDEPVTTTSSAPGKTTGGSPVATTATTTEPIRPPVMTSWVESPIEKIPPKVEELAFDVISGRNIQGTIAWRSRYPHAVGLQLARTHEEYLSILEKFEAFEWHGLNSVVNRLGIDEKAFDEGYFAEKSLIVWHFGGVTPSTSEINSVILANNQLIVDATITFTSIPPLWLMSRALLIEIEDDGVLDAVDSLIPFTKVVVPEPLTTGYEHYRNHFLYGTSGVR